MVSPIPYYIMNMRLQKIGLSFLCLIILFSSCQWKVQEKKKEDNNMTISVIRFDKLLNDYVEFNSFSALQKMNTECPMEMKLLIGYLPRQSACR